MSDTTSAPLVSIVIPVYNGANYLKKSIESALSQTYPRTEVIVVNDGSTDNGETAAIARSYGDRIVYIEKENGGVSSALNLGIRRMKGAFFSWLSHDDEYTPEKVEDSVNALIHAGCVQGNAIAYTGHTHIDCDSNVLRVYRDVFEKDRFYPFDEMVRFSVSHQALNGCCMLIPVKALRETGGFDENLRYAQDALMWFRLFYNGIGLVFDGKTNVGYRLHAAQTSRVRRDLFDRDMSYISNEVSKCLFKDADGAKTAYLYARRLSRYGTRGAVTMVIDDAKRAGYPFSVTQRLTLHAGLSYSRLRSVLKKIYYRFFLRART